MLFLKGFGRFLKYSCIFFTVGILLFLIAGAVMDRFVTGDDGSIGIYLSAVLFGSLACFSAFLAFAFTLCTYLPCDMLAKVLIHFGITYVGFYVSFFVLAGNYSLLGSFVYLSFIFFAVYAVICAVFLAVRGFAARLKNFEKDYKPLYK